MFQNIDLEEEQREVAEEEATVNKNEKVKQMLRKLFTKQNILMYIISFMLSTVSSINGMAPFGLAIFAAALSNALPVRNNIHSNTYRDKLRFWRRRNINISNNKLSVCFYGINLQTLV